MNEKIIDSGNIKDRTKKNTIHLGLWSGAWVLATAGAAFGPKFLWDFNTLPTIIGISIHICIGFGMIYANKQHLLGMDEMQRHIQHEAMALTLGVGLVLGMSYELLEDIKLISFEPEISHLIILMCLTYFIGIIRGNRRYQ
jgi:hypothetical protein